MHNKNQENIDLKNMKRKKKRDLYKELTSISAENAYDLKEIMTELICTDTPSITRSASPYFPASAPPELPLACLFPAVLLGALKFSHVSITTETQSRNMQIGFVFKAVHCILIVSRLHLTDLIASHVGNSNKSIITPSSNSSPFSSPSPRIALIFNFAGSKFLANLRQKLDENFETPFENSPSTEKKTFFHRKKNGPEILKSSFWRLPLSTKCKFSK